MRKLDETDLAIIEALKADGRVANREIARRLSVSETMVRTRIRRLEADKVLRVGVVLNPIAEGLAAAAYIGITTKPGAAQAVADVMTNIPYMSYVGVTLGPFDLLALPLARDQAELQALVTNEISTIEGVRRVEVLPITGQFKHAAHWTNISEGVSPDE